MLFWIVTKDAGTTGGRGKKTYTFHTERGRKVFVSPTIKGGDNAGERDGSDNGGGIGRKAQEWP